MDNIWKIAVKIAESSNCEKRHVACIIVDDNGTMVSTGYNWHEDGVCDCDTTKTAVHAEINAINDIPEDKRSDRLYAYITHKPCDRCESLLRTICQDIRYEDLSPRLDVLDEPEEDKVNPKHYQDVDGVPTIRFFEEATDQEGYKGYLQLTALKYLYRLDSKDDALTNIRKAKWFINKLEELLND